MYHIHDIIDMDGEILGGKICGVDDVFLMFKKNDVFLELKLGWIRWTYDGVDRKIVDARFWNKNSLRTKSAMYMCELAMEFNDMAEFIFLLLGNCSVCIYMISDLYICRYTLCLALGP